MGKLNKNLKIKEYLFNKRNGETYVELLIYIAVLTIFMSGIIMYTLISQKQRLYANAMQEVDYNLALLNHRVEYEVSNCSSFTINSSDEITLNYDLSEDAYKDPMTIRIENGFLELGYGSTGVCTNSAPCKLSTNLVNVNSINFEDLTIPNGAPTLRYTIDVVYSGNSMINSENVIHKSISNTVTVKSKL